MDPLEEYLAKKTAGPAASGDPLEAYLAQKQAGGLSMADRQAKLDSTRAKTAALAAEPDPTSFGQVAKAVRHDVYERGAALVRGLKAVGAHPIATFTEPERRRELERGIDDSVTLGYGRRIADKVGRAVGSEGPFFDETEAADRDAAPDVRTGGQIMGVFTPGGVKTIGKAALGVAGKTAARAPFKAALAYELAAPATAALHADSAGHRAEAAASAATDPGGMPLAAMTGLLGNAISKRIQGSRGYQARQTIEQKGGGARVGVTTPGEGGVFDKELADVPLDSRGEGIAAKRGAQNLLAGLEEEHQAETAKPYKVMKAQIDNSSAAMQPRDVTSIVTNMQNAVDDLETAPQVRAQLEQQLKILEKHRADPESPVMLPERQLNGLRRSLMRAAKVGMTDAPGEKEAPLRAAAFEAKKLVDEGPYAPLNKFYAEGAQKMRDSRTQLSLKPRAPSDSAVDERKLKLTLLRSAQNTNTAGGDANLDAFKAARPNLAAQVDLAELAKARAELAFRVGAPKHGGLFDRLGHDTGMPLMGAGAAAATGHPMAIGGLAAYLLGNNATPIAGRLLAPMADAQGTLNPLRSSDQQDPGAEQRRRLIRLLMGGAQ